MSRDCPKPGVKVGYKGDAKGKLNYGITWNDGGKGKDDGGKGEESEENEDQGKTSICALLE